MDVLFSDTKCTLIGLKDFLPVKIRMLFFRFKARKFLRNVLRLKMAAVCSSEMLVRTCQTEGVVNQKTEMCYHACLCLSY